jgi:hypothetical protein
MQHINFTILVIVFTIVSVASGAVTNIASETALNQLAIQGTWKFAGWNTNVSNACNVWPGVICDTEGSVTAMYKNSFRKTAFFSNSLYFTCRRVGGYRPFNGFTMLPAIVQLTNLTELYDTFLVVFRAFLDCNTHVRPTNRTITNTTMGPTVIDLSALTKLKILYAFHFCLNAPFPPLPIIIGPYRNLKDNRFDQINLDLCTLQALETLYVPSTRSSNLVSLVLRPWLRFPLQGPVL